MDNLSEMKPAVGPALERLTMPIEGQRVFAAELPDYGFLLQCVRCGRCLPVCPTYQETALEPQSPRGRLSLIRAVEDGKLAFDREVEQHLFHCLDCRMCNTVCPAGVPVGQSILAARAAFGERLGRPWWRKLVCGHVLISATRLGRVMVPVRLYQLLGLPALVKPLLRVLPGRLFARLSQMEALLPQLPMQPLHTQLDPVTPAIGSRKYRVGFFLGCMMSQIFAVESRATVNVLTGFGCEVATPHGQVCCGAPQDDQGDRGRVREFARRNVALFETVGEVDAIVADCAACSSMLKEYGELLKDDPQFAARATAFSAKVRDIYEWYDEILPASVGTERPAKTGVTIHDACHLANAQGVREAQRRVLGRMPGVQIREMQAPSACCGSAGIYNVTHPDMANLRLERKLKDIADTGALIVVTNGPGCLLQLRAGLRQRDSEVQIRHISSLVQEAMRGDTL